MRTLVRGGALDATTKFVAIEFVAVFWTFSGALNAVLSAVAVTDDAPRPVSVVRGARQTMTPTATNSTAIAPAAAKRQAGRANRPARRCQRLGGASITGASSRRASRRAAKSADGSRR